MLKITCWWYKTVISKEEKILYELMVTSLITSSGVIKVTSIWKHEFDNPRIQEPSKCVVIAAGVFS